MFCWKDYLKFFHKRTIITVIVIIYTNDLNVMLKCISLGKCLFQILIAKLTL